jgi:hypothetical protein
VDGGNWRGEAWPKPDARARQRLPRVDDLPAAQHGYDRERVREAFDSFYRHIAQLDSTVRALEAVEVFRDQAGELRKELRALKAAGWTQQPWPSYAPARVSPGMPESLPRFAIEAAFLITVAVVVAVAGFDRLSIVLVMALAWSIVGVVEWAASRERFARARVPAPARAAAQELPPAPLRIVPAHAAAAPPAESWEGPAEVAEPAEDERTVVRPAEPDSEPAPVAKAEVVETEAEVVLREAEPEPIAEPEVPVELEPVAEAEAEPVEEEPDVLELGPEQEPEPAASRWSWAADVTVERARERELAERPPAPRKRFWQRRGRDSDGYRFDAAPPRHVRVLPPEPSFDEQFPVEPSDRVDPWEQDLDLSIEEPEGRLEPDGGPEEAREYAQARPQGEPDR